MTWVFGTATDFFGTAICVADIQVTLEGGETMDCLQKIYPLARNVVAGFAGNVEVGFSMLDGLADLIHGERPDGARETMDKFSQIAQDRFARAPVASREQGSELLIAYVLPDPRLVYGGRPIVARFRYPDFGFEEIPRGTWSSIGSGNDVPAYRQELERLTGEQTSPLLQMEANTPGGYASAMFIALTHEIAEFEAAPGVSRHFQTCIVTADGCRGGNSDKTMFGPEGQVIEIKMPEVATNLGELQNLLRTKRNIVPTLATAIVR